MMQPIAVAYDQYNQLRDAGCGARIDAAKQAAPHPVWSSQSLVRGNVVNAIRVAGRVLHLANQALQRMLDRS